MFDADSLEVELVESYPGPTAAASARARAAVVLTAGYSQTKLRPARSRRRTLVAASVATMAFAGAGIAIAGGLGAFDGIGAAQHPQGPTDVLDPTVVAGINESNPIFSGGPTGTLLPDSARFTRELPSGERVYALTTTTDELCVLIAAKPGGNMKYGVGCGDPLDRSQPTTIASERPSPSVPPLTYGVAIDGADAVSFMSEGEDVVVPVQNNVWAYEGESSGLSDLTVHFSDGTTEALHNGQLLP